MNQQLASFVAAVYNNSFLVYNCSNKSSKAGDYHDGTGVDRAAAEDAYGRAGGSGDGRAGPDGGDGGLPAVLLRGTVRLHRRLLIPY